MDSAKVSNSSFLSSVGIMPGNHFFPARLLGDHHAWLLVASTSSNDRFDYNCKFSEILQDRISGLFTEETFKTMLMPSLL